MRPRGWWLVLAIAVVALAPGLLIFLIPPDQRGWDSWLAVGFSLAWGIWGWVVLHYGTHLLRLDIERRWNERGFE